MRLIWFYNYVYLVSVLISSTIYCLHLLSLFARLFCVNQALPFTTSMQLPATVEMIGQNLHISTRLRIKYIHSSIQQKQTVLADNQAVKHKKASTGTKQSIFRR